MNAPSTPTLIAAPVFAFTFPFPTSEPSSFLAESTMFNVPFTVIVVVLALSVFDEIVAPQRSSTIFVPDGISTFSLVLANISIVVWLPPYFSSASLIASSRVL